MTRRLAIVAIALIASSCPTLTPRATPPQRATITAHAHSAIRPKPDGTPHPGARVERAALHVATQFLTGYLRLTYGHATRDQTVHRLVGAPLRVPEMVRRLHPRVVRLELDWAGPMRVTVLATINDSRGSYPVAIGLSRQGSGFRVVALEP
jgi:hypothetical protein